jgi:hypothetical protein
MVAVEPLTLEEKREALRRALDSHTFARSEQLRSFLRYVCEAKFRGVSTEVTEYVIGTEVLHRPADYSPAEDSIVRTRAYELRQKLEKLYSGELSGDAVQIVIPKGAYIPQFVRTLTESPTKTVDKSEPPVSAPAAVVKVPPKRRGVFVIVMLIAAAGGAASALWIQARLKPPSEIAPIIREAWAPFVKPNNSVLLVPATPLYLVLGPATHGAYGSSIYPAPPEAYSLFRQQRPLAPGARLGMIFTKDALGVGNMNAVVTVSSIVRALGGASEVLPERPAMMALLHDRDTVLFGAPVDSQVISDILASTPLSVVYDEGVKEFVIRDRSNGHTIVPEKDMNGDFRTVYGLVTVLNNRESDHGRLGMIVFSGITSVGTHGAAEYFTSAKALRSLRALFAHQGISGFPPAYQVVVKCKFENMLLIGEEFQSYRILKRD